MQSAPGAGTTFAIYLPCVDAPVEGLREGVVVGPGEITGTADFDGGTGLSLSPPSPPRWGRLREEGQGGTRS